MQEPRSHDCPEPSETQTDVFGVQDAHTGPHPMALDAEDVELAAQAPGAPEAVWEELEELFEEEPELAQADSLRSPFERILRAVWLPMRLGACSWLAYILVFNLSVVRGSSMAPGIHDGDRIVVDEFSYLFTDIDRGDIVVLRYPLDPNLDYIKRVVGLPGDKISMSEGELWINGERIEERYTLELDPYTLIVEVVVKEDHYFVLGDNRLHSSDSREFGQVAAGLVRGKVDLRLWPFERIGLLD